MHDAYPGPSRGESKAYKQCSMDMFQHLLCKMHLICALCIGIFVHRFDMMAWLNDSSVRGDGSTC
ncbi:hypothetical protein P692DRAFT_20173266 [Suillus brevipes Sb2]|nr:hypothetical protein P692DRAFT_20173266 [Suillus brevipes Sb2]